jgi:hypothetical protein
LVSNMSLEHALTLTFIVRKAVARPFKDIIALDLHETCTR